jgi:hypothetical protein
MMPARNLEIGDLVTLLTDDARGLVGIVSQPITAEHPGHVLVQKDGCILGVGLSLQDVSLAERSQEGFAQLAYNLIQLGSRVIESRLIV